MKYIADILTGSRIIMAIVSAVAIISGHWMLAIVTFVLGMLTDAIDGIAARRWPYPTNEMHWWRRDPHVYDNIADATLMYLVLIVLAIVNWVWWVILAGVTVYSILMINLIEHIKKTNVNVAEKIDVGYGLSYAVSLGCMLVVLTLKATNAWWPYLIYILAAGMLLILKWDRATSRPETRVG